MASMPIAYHSHDFAYGSLLSVSSSILVAAGLALQKTGHLRVRQKPVDEREAVIYQPIWVLGLMMMLSGEVGNLLSYGDRLTPTAAVTSIGCFGVVANLLFAAAIFKEPLSLYDYVGVVFITAGVIFIIFFAPNNPAPLTASSLKELLAGWGAITIYIVYGLLFLAIRSMVRRHGHTSAIWYSLLSSLVGSFSVIASKPVASFLLLSFEGLSNDQMDDQLQPAVLSEAECAASEGYGVGTAWRLLVGSDMLLVNATHGCYFEGLNQFDEPLFYLAIVVLVVSAFFQVKYLNDALALFKLSSVIPIQYVLFTTFSVVGAIVVYREYEMLEYEGCTQWWTLHMFLDGVFGTFLGVYFITTRKIVIDADDPESIQEAMLALEAEGRVQGASEAIYGEPLLRDDPELPRADGTVQIVLGAKPPKDPNTPGATAPGERVESTSALSGSGLNLSRQQTRDLIMGGRAGSALSGSGRSLLGGSGGTSTRVSGEAPGGGELASAARGDEEEAVAVPARTSFMDKMETLGETVTDTVTSVLPKLPQGFDARAPDDRTSRASNVMNFLSALSGGQQAMFLYEPEDKRTRDSQAAQRAAARASAAEAVQESRMSQRRSSRFSRSSRANHSNRSEPTTTTTEDAEGVGLRNRSQSTPQQYTAPQGHAGATRHSMLPGIGE